jgi:hypothetical protein
METNIHEIEGNANESDDEGYGTEVPPTPDHDVPPY